MLDIDWDADHGWGKPKIIPFKNLSVHPFSSALHYAIQCF